MKVRRVVTGQDQVGKSVFVSDDLIDPIVLDLMPGLEFVNVWGGDDTPSLPTNGARPPVSSYFPRSRGYRFAIFTLPPDGSASLPRDLDVQRALAEVDDKLPGMMAHMEPGSPGMHTTDTIDLDLVLAGDIYLELDDGKEVHLSAGECVIQNGTRHAWHNRSTEPVRMLSILVGAERRS